MFDTNLVSNLLVLGSKRCLQEYRFVGAGGSILAAIIGSCILLVHEGRTQSRVSVTIESVLGTPTVLVLSTTVAPAAALQTATSYTTTALSHTPTVSPTLPNVYVSTVFETSTVVETSIVSQTTPVIYTSSVFCTSAVNETSTTVHTTTVIYTSTVFDTATVTHTSTEVPPTSAITTTTIPTVLQASGERDTSWISRELEALGNRLSGCKTQLELRTRIPIHPLLLDPSFRTLLANCEACQREYRYIVQRLGYKVEQEDWDFLFEIKEID